MMNRLGGGRSDDTSFRIKMPTGTYRSKWNNDRFVKVLDSITSGRCTRVAYLTMDGRIVHETKTAFMRHFFFDPTA